ncbi:MAG: methylmalonyl-CoA mutase family protein [Pseudomonadota bacterium]|nr:methylmalonyl-CoA mutase family protein [Pseudomonadota bacterium]
MILIDAVAAVRRYREQVHAQAQLARDIQHLREVARMLFEDKPDKIKAVEAVNDIAAKRLVQMDVEARALLDSASSIAGRRDSRDRGDLLSWLMLVNQPGQFPYTQGIADPSASGKRTGPSRSLVLRGATTAGPADHDAARRVAAALAEGWTLLDKAARDVLADQVAVDALAARIAIEFDEHRDAAHRALGRAARRLWAVTLREHFDARGDSLKLVVLPVAQQAPADDAIAGSFIGSIFDDTATDRAEEAVLEALRALATPPGP